MQKKNKEQMYNGFKLISLELRNTTIMNKSNITYKFIEDEDNQELIYTTVLIGVNGTGKSNLFRIVIELLKELHDLSNNKSRDYNIDGQFNLKFSLDNYVYEYTNMDYMSNQVTSKVNTANLLRNGVKVDYKEAKFPNAIVANSIMLTDKYPFFKKEKSSDGKKVETFPQYKYLGVRNIAQSASTRAYVRKTVEFIAQEFNSDIFIKGLSSAANFLDLDETIEIYYYTINTHKFFKGNLTPKILRDYFEEMKKKYPNAEDNPPFKLNYYLKSQDDVNFIESVCGFCNILFNDNQLIQSNNKHDTTRKIVYNLFNKKSFTKLNNDYTMLENLRQLGMISAPEIQLNKSGYSLQESSSGEYHFFSSIVGLLATVKENSLVFIDEPEISLHPNWQMKYLTFIRELFSGPEYATSHILVATHSHFLISDLKADSSKIIGLKKESGKIKIVNIPENIDTFGWSPDDILYNVFDVVSSRNKFVAEDIANILDTLSNGSIDQKNKIERKTYDTLIHLEKSLKNNDPLKEVVKSILKKVIK